VAGVMKDLESSVLNSIELEIKEHISIIDDIIQIQRQKDDLDSEQGITQEERDAILKRALDTYKLLNKMTIGFDGKVLIEYRDGLHKIVKEVIL
jgi:hypothetical protein